MALCQSTSLGAETEKRAGSASGGRGQKGKEEKLPFYLEVGQVPRRGAGYRFAYSAPFSLPDRPTRLGGLHLGGHT